VRICNKLSTHTREESVSESIGEPKKKLLYYLKVMQIAGLSELAEVMGISRMGVHKHLEKLRERGMVDSIEVRKGVGRPRMQYQLTSQGKTLFPKSYSDIATSALDFIERSVGQQGVESFLKERQEKLYIKYGERLKDLGFDRKVKELARIRDQEGYIAESRKQQKNDSHILLEYNCPIIQIAEKHWEACSVETELFEKLLDANIETTHRAAKGDQICRFVIKERKQDFL
jgi:predicted ArsR family transcriptional regulator